MTYCVVYSNKCDSKSIKARERSGCTLYQGFYTINLIATTKITNQRITATKPTKEVKYNHKTQSIQKRQKKRKKETKKKWNKCKTSNVRIDLNLTVLIIKLKVNCLCCMT